MSPRLERRSLSSLLYFTGNAGAYPMGGLVYIITYANLGLLGAPFLCPVDTLTENKQTI